ncbi:MAG: hypothetical protein AB1449_02450 [Chloroflexota bacterium]
MTGVEMRTATQPAPTPWEATPTAEQAPATLAAEPMTIEFQASDGEELVGTYYPPSAVPAPAVVLMHWVRSDETDWSAVAPWLQNRSLILGEVVPAPSGQPWLDASWFPTIPPERGYAVFTFTFRNCQGGCRGFDPEGWLMDARAALQTAAGLPGVDPMRVAAVGASIGADGAVDACAWLNSETTSARCLGALSLSPGGYLGVPYAQAVEVLLQALDESGLPVSGEAVLCLASEQDQDSARACASVTRDKYRAVMYTGRAHGMELIEPGRSPDVLQLMLDFLAQALGP